MKQNVRFQVGICPEKGQTDQIQNGRLSANIDFNMHNIWKILLTIILKQNMQFQVGYISRKNFNFDQIQNSRLSTIHFKMLYH